ncbi:MAG: SGNH/GDSL hydrolase family protein [Verrucomicrobiota bacterium]
MVLRKSSILALACGVVLFLTSCTSHQPNRAAHVLTGESVILVGEEPASLAFAPLRSPPVKVRSTYRDGLPQTVHYESGRDYVLEASGQIRRIADSRIPDFRTNVLYGKDDFNHSQFPGFGNSGFFVFVDYSHREKWPPVPPPSEPGGPGLPKTRKKLSAGEKIRIVAYGDSITAGGDASATGLIFWERWADALRQKYPRATIEAINGATGGDSTVQGLQRLPEKVLAQKPDLVLIGFGMNDHNRGGVPPAAFAGNLRTMIDHIRADTGAEIVLFSAFPPNPKWHYGTHNMAAYAAATEAVAREKNCAFADVYHHWMEFAEKKKPEDLLGNNINHPNDFGHWIYFQALAAMNLP